MKHLIAISAALVVALAACSSPLQEVGPASGDTDTSGSELPLASTGGPITPSDGELSYTDAASSNEFGTSVSTSGDTIVVGAYRDDVSGSTDAGSVTVYTRESDGAWTQTATLTASDAAASDWFGFSAAVSGDTLVVGARLDDDAGTNTGAIYVFTRGPDGSWTQAVKLLPADAASFSEFGYSVAIDGDTIVAGAVLADDPAFVDAGAAYVFVRDATGVWSEQAKLVAADPGLRDQFGYAVALSGDTAIVGARLDDDAGASSGSAYVFRRDSNGSWSQEAKLIASDAAADDQFGISVAIEGDRAVVGSYLEDTTALNAGAVYIFSRSGSSWSEEAKLTASDAAATDLFGGSVGLKGDQVVVGAAGADGPLFENQGAAYLFAREDSGGWSEHTKLVAADPAEGDAFGRSVAIDQVIAVGAPLAAQNGVAGSGVVYLFNLVRSCDIRLDELVIRDGSAVIDYEGTDSGKQGTGLRLTSFGKVYDDGVPIRTAWRLRNASDGDVEVVLDAYGTGYSVTLTLAARSETYILSPIADGAATHRLFLDGAQIDVKASSQSEYDDDRTVVDPDC